MLKTISASDLRAQAKRVLNEVEYGQAQYIVVKFGEPTAAIVSMDDFRLLQQIRQRQAANSLREVVAELRLRARDLDPAELDALVEEARSDFYNRMRG